VLQESLTLGIREVDDDTDVTGFDVGAPAGGGFHVVEAQKETCSIFRPQSREEPVQRLQVDGSL
jgi:hypothetical protein